MEQLRVDVTAETIEDEIVTCQHCSQDFICEKVKSKNRQIKTLNQALQIKEQDIQRLERELKKRDLEIFEDDESDQDPYYSPEKKTSVEVQGIEKTVLVAPDSPNLEEEPEMKKRKTTETTDKGISEDGSKSLNTNDSNILVDVNHALQKLAEIPLLDYYLKMYKKYVKDFNNKWIPSSPENINACQIKPNRIQAILDNLSEEKRNRTKLIAKLVDVIHNQNEFTTTDETYGTDIQFLDVGYPTTKCNYCHTEAASQISCYCINCNIFICDKCVNKHRMEYINHEYINNPETN